MSKQFFLFRWIAQLFGRMKKLAEKFITPSVIVVEAINKAVNSGGMALINALIPGQWDDILIAKIKTYLPQVLQTLRISDECLKLENPDEIISCAIKKLREYNPEGQAAAYHNIAALLAVHISDKKISWREALHLAEEIYQQRKAAAE